jgi:rubrerythrin
MELFMILTITLGGLLYVGYPLFTDAGRWQSTPRRTPSREEELQARKRHALSAIRELEFDYQTGKLSDEDYRSLRSRYEKEAVDAMKGLDGLGKGGRKLRTRKGEEGGLICSSCGEEVPSRSRFCPNCGTRFDGAEQSS